MTYFQAFVIALVQGVTELVPVSSLGHWMIIFATIPVGLVGWSYGVRSERQGLM